MGQREYYFAIFYFLIYKPKIPKYLLYHLSISITSHFLQVTVKGLTTPISHWVQVCLIVCAGIR